MLELRRADLLIGAHVRKGYGERIRPQLRLPSLIKKGGQPWYSDLSITAASRPLRHESFHRLSSPSEITKI